MTAAFTVGLNQMWGQRSKDSFCSLEKSSST